MNELNSIETQSNLDTIPLSQFNFIFKKLSKYIAAFDYIGKTLIALSTTSGGISVISFTSVTGIPAGIATASFTLIFSLTTGLIKNY